MAALLVVAIPASAAKLEVTSPAGVVKANVWVGDSGRLTYSVERGGTVEIEPSSLGITVDGVDLGFGVRLEQPQQAS